MKISSWPPLVLGLAVVTLLGVCGVRAQVNVDGAAAPPIPVDREPRHHVAFADERLRVLEVRIPGHDTTLNHSHDRDLLTVNVENGPTRTRSVPGEWSGVRTRDVGGVNVTEYTGKASSHIVQTMGDGAYRLTGVENRKSGGWSVFPPIDDPGARVVADTRAFRAYEMRLGAGGTAAHTHPVPVVVTLVKGSITARPVDKGALTVPGQWMVLPAGVAHVLATDAAATIVEVEVR